LKSGNTAGRLVFLRVLVSLRQTAAIALLATATSPAQAQPLEIRDDRGVVVKLDAPARRIVTLAPHLTELSFAAGAGERLIAVSRYSDFPPEATKLPQIGDSARFDVERLLALKPDLLLGWKSGNPQGEIARLEKLGLRVFVTEIERLPDIARVLRVIGTLAGSENGARAAQNFALEIDALRDRYAVLRPVRVFYEIWPRPLLTVNGAHIISDVIALCGGRNVFAHLPVLTPAVSEEAVIAAAPDLVAGGDSASGARTFETRWENHSIQQLRRMPRRHVAPDVIQRPTPRIIAGARTVCRHLEAMRRAPTRP
jgi:iron complex transport system substrate-binding protein